MKKAKQTDNCERRKFFFELFMNKKVSDGKQAVRVAIVVI